MVQTSFIAFWMWPTLPSTRPEPTGRKEGPGPSRTRSASSRLWLMKGIERLKRGIQHAAWNGPPRLQLLKFGRARVPKTGRRAEAAPAAARGFATPPFWLFRFSEGARWPLLWRLLGSWLCFSMLTVSLERFRLNAGVADLRLKAVS